MHIPYSDPTCISGLDPTNKNSQIQIFIVDNSENFEPSNFLEKSKKISSDFLVQLAGQISENKIQEFLIG